MNGPTGPTGPSGPTGPTEPTGPTGGHPVDELAAYALDALGDTERRVVDDHLAGCDVCQAELADHHETLAALAPDEAAPAAVWDRIAAGIGGSEPDEPRNGGAVVSLDQARERAGAAAGAPAGAAAGARRPGRIRWVAAVAALTAAAASGTAFGFALGGAGDPDGNGDIGTLAQAASDDPEGTLATLADSGGQPVARVVADEDGAYILLEGLQDLPEGQAYQLWSFTGPEPVSLGMLGRYGTNTVAFRLPPTITDLGISVEQTSGEPAPSGQIEATGPVSHRS